MSFYPFIERLGVIFPTERSHSEVDVLLYTPNFTTCNFATNNWGKSTDLMFVLHALQRANSVGSVQIARRHSIFNTLISMAKLH